MQATNIQLQITSKFHVRSSFLREGFEIFMGSHIKWSHCFLVSTHKTKACYVWQCMVQNTSVLRKGKEQKVFLFPRRLKSEQSVALYIIYCLSVETVLEVKWILFEIVHIQLYSTNRVWEHIHTSSLNSCVPYDRLFVRILCVSGTVRESQRCHEVYRKWKHSQM